ncbi:hypothetical protein V7O62_00355 [Methanolobus sp. ZRKC2]|uniref:hypothetical protein n=1 Tax=Methanolobus sp. ZRKC2 TaxID=3125783 RepID=UPI0032506640
MSEISEDIVELQEQNRQTAINNLKDAYGVVEKLVQKTYMNNEMDANSSLRNIRTDVSRLISEMGSKGLSTFSGKKGKLEEFYAAEDRFIDASVAFLDTVTSSISSRDSIDVFSLEGNLELFEKSLNSRIIIDKTILDEFRAQQAEIASTLDNGSQNALNSEEVEVETPGSFMGSASEIALPTKEKASPFGVKPAEHVSQSVLYGEDINEVSNHSDELDAETLSRLYNYFNILEHKYSHCHPEVSVDGRFIGDRKWTFEISDKCIRGTVKDGVFRSLLRLETCWHPEDNVKEMMQFVQSVANAVPREQFQSFCLVNSGWNEEIREWATSFMHPRLMLFLVELNTDSLIFNETVDSSINLLVWHNSDKKTESLEEKLQNFIEENEYFDAGDIAEETGLNIKGAEQFLQELVKRKKIIDVGFGTSKYTKSKI